ncbi:MAG TPA: hypothetical protein VFK69_10560 [Candidatus Eisenbacteria bacterium]|nr:hypothetical protein [Candidatus Eisenbacteria bacterium]
MRHLPVSLLLLLALGLARPAAAQTPGIDLSWDQCWDEGTQTTNRIFTCDSNVTHPVATIVGSFSPASNMPNFIGLEATLDIITVSDSLPPWWWLYTGGCRPLSLSASGDFTATPQQVCMDPFAQAGVPLGGVGAYQNVYNAPSFITVPNTARIKLAFAVASPSPIVAGTTYLAFVVHIDGRSSYGAGACRGCVTPACFALESVRASQSTYDDEVLQQPMHNDWLGWQCAQGGNFEYFTCGGQTCITASRNRTWGGIKALYRDGLYR